MSKPAKTAADYMVIALSPALIMALVGSLCFFLIEVFYRGQMEEGVRWVMFWNVLAIVLISRIAIEQSPEYAAVYGAALALATWVYLVRTHPAYLLGIVLLAVVWFCAHKLVWDCTLIDEDQDSSGQGLLQAAPAKAVKKNKKGKGKAQGAQSPGRWVVYFSLAALPLFGVGQKLLPAGDKGFVYLMIYLGAALGLLVTTSFLGLRRYLRQRYLKMPATVAAGWLKFGIGVAIFVLAAAVLLPRPGANQAWASLRYHIDYQLRQASRYASRLNAPGKGEGREGNQTAEQGKKEQGLGETGKPQQGPGPPTPAPSGQPGPSPNPAPLPQPGPMYGFFKVALAVLAVLVVGGWIISRRQQLMEMLRAVLAALAEWWRKLLAFGEVGRLAKRIEPELVKPRYRSFAQYKNPFFTGQGEAWPPEQILIYTYEALQVWAKEQGVEFQPAQTAREFCGELAGRCPQLDGPLQPTAHLYGHAAYGRKLPPGSNLEPVKELWRRLAVPQARAA